MHFTYQPELPEAIKGIDLMVREGEFVGLIGANGAGKSTLLKCVVGLLQPTSGRILVNGIDTHQVSVAELTTQVGFVLQNPDQQLFAQTVEEEVAFGPNNLGLTREEIQSRVDAALSSTDMEAFRREFPPALAKGFRARVAIASVLAMQPRIIILDEPTTGQDHYGCHQIMQIARKLHREGCTVLVVTHQMALIAEYTTRTVVLQQGKVLLDEPTAGVFSRTEILREAQIVPPQITRLSQSLPEELGLPQCALKVEDMGRAVVERLTSFPDRQ